MKALYKLMWVRIIGIIIVGYCIIPGITVLAHVHGEDHAINNNGASSLTIYTGIISLIIVIFLIAVLMGRLHRQGSTLSTMSGMMATMTVGMLSSLIVGTIAGIVIERLFLSAVIGVLFGIVVGYILGLPLSLLASMDGMLSGIMGGMMGAMLGVMVTTDYPTLTIVFVDLLFFVAMAFLYKLLETEVVTLK